MFIGGLTSYTSAYTELEGRASTDPNVTMQGNYATAWGNGTEAEGDYSTAFGNFTKTAAVTSFKYNGTEAKVVSKQVEVKDANGNTIMITDPGNPESGATIPATELKYTIVNANNPEEKLSDTYFDSEDAAMNEIVQNGTITGGYGATAFGLLTEAKGALRGAMVRKPQAIIPPPLALKRKPKELEPPPGVTARKPQAIIPRRLVIIQQRQR